MSGLRPAAGELGPGGGQPYGDPGPLSQMVTTNSLDVGNENGIRIVHLADFLLAEKW